MAKIRVYELAKDLSMKNKALLEKLKELNISVRSHMSSLEDETVARIKAFLGGKNADFTQDKSDKRVIRRPKKPKIPVRKQTAEDMEQHKTDKPAEETLNGFTVDAEARSAIPAQELVSDPAERTPVQIEEEAGEKEILLEAAEGTVSVRETAEGTGTLEENMQCRNILQSEPEREPEEREQEPEKQEQEPEEQEQEPGTDNMFITAEAVVTKMVEHVPESTLTEHEFSLSVTQDTSVIEPPDVLAVEEVDIQQPAQGEGTAMTVTQDRIIQQDPVLENISPISTKEDNLKTMDQLAIVMEQEVIEDLAESSDLAKSYPNQQTEPVPDTTTDSKDEIGKKISKSKKKGKKHKRDMPARIIKLPTLTEETELESAEVLEVPEVKEVEEVSLAKEVMEEDKKKKKWKKDEDEKEQGGRWSKKKTSFKRKEVIMGEDIYAERGRKRKGSKVKPPPPSKTAITIPKAIKRRIKIDDTIIIADLAKRMGIKAGEMIAKLMPLGVMVTVNQTIDYDTAELVASEFGYEVERAAFEEEEILRTETDEPDLMAYRPPVVTIMGHVDHGKTSLLDVIRRTRITEMEAGGITQHIGAYYVTTKRGQIAFLDTPGHEAFTAMRSRGAKITDIVVLVVAADDGVMPQTIEAINHAKASSVPIIVALNKMDKPGADPDKVYRELSVHGLTTEDWGGDTIFVKVSAKTQMGIDELLEMILLQSEVLELKANPNKLARGYVVESKLDTGRGPVATILVQEGTLHVGDAIVCGIHHGRIRALLDDCGVQVESAGPSIPVEVLGLTGVPNAGDELIALPDEKSAKQVSAHRSQKQRSVELAKTSRMSLERLFEKMKQGEVKDLNLIIKADVHGSIEALADSLIKLSNEEVSINVIHSGAGTVTESDVSLAAVSNAIIIGFNVRPTAKVQAMAVEESVDMRFYNIIYHVIKDVKDAIWGLMASRFEDRVLGRAQVREVFHVPKIGSIAGSYIIDGKIERNRLVRIIRDGALCFQGKLGSLRRFKDDVKEVQAGYECGIGIENFNDIKVGDIIECYYLEEVKPEMSVI